MTLLDDKNPTTSNKQIGEIWEQKMNEGTREESKKMFKRDDDNHR